MMCQPQGSLAIRLDVTAASGGMMYSILILFSDNNLSSIATDFQTCKGTQGGTLGPTKRKPLTSPSKNVTIWTDAKAKGNPMVAVYLEALGQITSVHS